MAKEDIVEIKNRKEAIFNNYRYKKVRDMYYVTTDDGSWALMSERDFDDFQNKNMTESLFKLLENTGILITDKSERELISRMRKKYNFLDQGTSLHIVVPTLRCNMTCLYCQASSVDTSCEGHDMDEETARKTVDFIFQSPSKTITIEFQGGEPLLNFEIIKYITGYAKESNKKHQKDLVLVIVTNLNAIDDEKLQFLLDNDIKICTSLDGPEEIHDHNRPLGGGGGSYSNVIKWSKKINEEYKKRGINDKPGALITVTQKALQSPKEVVDEYINNGYDTIHLRFLSSLGCATKAWKNIGYKPEEFIDFWKTAMEYIFEQNKKGVLIRERMAMIMLRKILGQGPDQDYLDLRSPCGAAIGQLLYNHDGSIFTCDEGRMVKGDIFKIGDVDMKYPEVLTSNKTCAIVASSVNDCFICDDCVYKPYCGLCPVCNYFEQGSIIAKVPETPRCKIYMAQFDYIVDKYFFDDECKAILDKWIKTGKNI